MNRATSLDVLTIGEAMTLFIAGQAGALAQVRDFARATAGAELNVAVGLARLGFRVGYVSRVGADSFGEHLLAFMDAQGIDRSHVRVDPEHPTGFMLKSRELDGGDPRIEYYRRNSAASNMSAADLPAAYCSDSRHLHLTGISPAISLGVNELVMAMAAQARSDGRKISFDPNLRPRLWASQTEMVACLNRIAVATDLVLPGLAEGQILTGRDTPAGIADFYRERGVAQVVVKLGADGAYVASDDEAGFVPGFRATTVVDTVGAGDGFAVGVISALLEGLSLTTAAERGNAIGARVVQFPGDCDGLPNRTELAQCLIRDQPALIKPV